MSLTPRQIAATRSELATALERSGLDVDQVARALGITERRVRDAIRLQEPVDSVDVWAVRDLLEHAVLRAEGERPRFSALTEQIRPRARGWFPLRDVPPSALDVLRTGPSRPPGPRP